MKTILCYGDSLTFGSDAENEGRHAFEDRWPSVLEAGLGGKARIIAEGLGGRTTVFDDHSSPADLNGSRVLPTLLKSHQPLDAVVIMLGTNDLKPFINGTAIGAAMGMQRLVQIVLSHPYDHQKRPPKIVVVAPPYSVATSHLDLKPMFDGAVAESRKLANHYARHAREMGVAFFDAAKVAKAVSLDGVHLDARNTRAIGEALVPVVKKLLGIR
ncbi:MAG: SGNH/GDSL hydrolase family protein [Cucumibacter sp.]